MVAASFPFDVAGTQIGKGRICDDRPFTGFIDICTVLGGTPGGGAGSWGR